MTKQIARMILKQADKDLPDQIESKAALGRILRNRWLPKQHRKELTRWHRIAGDTIRNIKRLSKLAKEAIDA